MSTDQYAGLALIAFGAAWYVRHLWRLWQEKAEATCRDMYPPACVAQPAAEAAPLEGGISAALHRPAHNPPPIDWTEHQRLAWLRLLLAVEESPDIDEYVASEAAWIDAEWEHFDERSAG